MQLQKLNIFQQKKIIESIIFDGATFQEIEEQYGVKPSDIAELINDKAVNPYNEIYLPKNQQDEEIHKKTVLSWVKTPIIVSVVCYLVVVLLQSILGGFESQIVTDSVAYITKPLAKIVNLGLAAGFIVMALHIFFPILSVFINDKVNTVYLKDEFIKAKPEGKLYFLGIIVMALCMLVGLVFSADAQTKPRECIVTTAYKELGTLEIGGNNRGARIDEYRSVSLGRKIKNYSDAWCAYFVSYCFKSCNIPYTGVNFSPRARDWFADSKKIVWRRNFQYGVIKRKPQAGDLIGYKFRSGTIGHIEVLYEWHDNYFLAIGGNTSNSNTVYRDNNTSDGVRLKKRLTNTAAIIANHID